MYAQGVWLAWSVGGEVSRELTAKIGRHRYATLLCNDANLFTWLAGFRGQFLSEV